MAISPQDYSLWSRMTGNRYPKTAREKAAVGPDVKKFVDNVAKQGAQGGKSEEKKEKVNITGKQIATGALGVGLVAGAVAAARRKGTRDAVTSFLSNLGDKPSTKTYTRPNQGDITPPPVQQQSSVVSTPAPENVEYSSLGSRLPGPLPNVSPATSVGYELKKLPDFSRPTTPYVPGSDPKNEKTEQYIRSLAQRGAFTKSDPERDTVSGIRLTDIQRKTPAFSEFKPADNTKPAPGTILGKDLSPEEKQKALAQAKLQEFYAGKYGVDKSGVRSARYEIEKQTSQKEPVVASQPSTENDEFYTRDELNTMGKIDKLVESIKTGNRPQQPRAVATDVKNTARLQSADNKTPKVTKIIGEPTVKSKHDTKMEVHEATNINNTINEYKGEFDNTYGKVLNQITQGNVTGANDRDKRRAERLTNKVLNKNNPGLVRRFHGAVKQDAAAATRISSEDASFVATRIFDEDTGKAATTGEENGAPLSRDMRQLRDVKNLETGTKTAIGREIKGRARLMDVNVTETPTRKDLVEGETADVPGALVGPSTVDLSQRATGQNLQYTGKRPAGEPGPAGKKGVRKVIQPSSEDDSGSRQAGIGIYGRELGKYPSGAMTKEGEYTPGASKKPTEVPFKNVGMTARERRPFGDVSNEQVIEKVKRDRSGKLTKTGKQAVEEIDSRNPSIKVLAGGKAVLGTGMLSDPTDKKRLGADFTQQANQSLQDITRLPVDEQPAARKRLLEGLRAERNVRKGVSDVFD